MKPQNFMRHMHVDIETYSPVPLKTCGVYRYAEEAEILMVCWSYDQEAEIHYWDFTRGPPPAQLLADLKDPTIQKHAHNAAFERTLFRAVWGLDCPPEQWACTMVLCFNLGLPGGLGDVCDLLKLGHLSKDKNGNKLIHVFCVPQKNVARIMPRDRPIEWQQFGHYCMQDVRAERAVHNVLSWFVIPQTEWALWYLDQRINDRGVPVDTELAESVKILTEERNRALTCLARLEGIKNPKSVKQVKEWLVSRGYDEPESLTKKNVLALLAEADGTEDLSVLEIRLQLCRSSVSKYDAFLRSVCKDGRARGMFQFYGAMRTGRWAGRLVQLHNLKSNDPDEVSVAILQALRRLVKQRARELLEMVTDDVADVFSQLIRTTIACKTGTRLLPCDYSAIEARVLAWAAQEDWRLEVFRTHGRIYETSAEQMFKMPPGSVTKKSPLRKKGKVAELACGYGGAVGAMVQMGGLEMGLTEDELAKIVAAWRTANPRIVEFWKVIEKAAFACLRTREPRGVKGRFMFTYEKGFLFMELPSGRKLAYPQARIEINPETGQGQITYWGKEKDRQTFGWVRTYGGKLTENYVQAVARDILGEGMLNLEAAGYQIILHVHDEPVPEMPIGVGSAKEMEEILSRPMHWAPDLPIQASGSEMPYYMKID